MTGLAPRDGSAPAGGPGGAVAPSRRHVLFRVGDVDYAIDARHVHRALAVREAPGATVRHGDRSYPVLDLRRLFRTGGTGSPAALLLVEAHGQEIALGVDAVGTLVSIPEGAVAPLPAIYRGAERGWLTGVVPVTGRLVVTVRPEGMVGGAALAGEPAPVPALQGGDP